MDHPPSTEGPVRALQQAEQNLAKRGLADLDTEQLVGLLLVWLQRERATLQVETARLVNDYGIDHATAEVYSADSIGTALVLQLAEWVNESG